MNLTDALLITAVAISLTALIVVIVAVVAFDAPRRTDHHRHMELLLEVRRHHAMVAEKEDIAELKAELDVLIKKEVPK